MRFLADSEYLQAITDLVNESKGRSLAVAVSYWREGVLEESKLERLFNAKDTNTDIRVVCDLSHPACKAAPIKQLIDGGVSVKRLNRLHAKVWLSPSTAVVGSANMSISALRLRRHGESNFEAGIACSSGEFVAKTRTWFDDIWNHQECIEVSDIDIQEKEEAHKSLAEQDSVTFSRGGNPESEMQPRRFEDIVGNAAGQEYRRALTDLGFQYSKGGSERMTIKFSQIRNDDSFVSGFIQALRRLVDVSENQRVTFTDSRPKLPPELNDAIDQAEDGTRRVLLQALTHWVETYDGENLRIRESWFPHKDGTIGYSIRLANDKCSTDGGSITLANIQPSEIRSGQHYRGKSGDDPFGHLKQVDTEFPFLLVTLGLIEIENVGSCVRPHVF